MGHTVSAQPTPSAARLRIISSMATAPLLRALVSAYEQRTATTIELLSIGGVEAARRVQDGEPWDVVVLAADAIERLLAGKFVQPGSRADLVCSSMAVAVRAGAHHPDIRSEVALRAAVLEAPSIAYSTGPSGTALLALLTRWGIDAQVHARLVQAKHGIPVAALIARGEAALGFQQLSELRQAPGIEVLGTLPDSCAVVTIFSGAIGAAAAQPRAAQALLAHWSSSETAELKRQFGLPPP